mgnify:CR=1 FL=1
MFPFADNETVLIEKCNEWRKISFVQIMQCVIFSNEKFIVFDTIHRSVSVDGDVTFALTFQFPFPRFVFGF